MPPPATHLSSAPEVRRTRIGRGIEPRSSPANCLSSECLFFRRERCQHKAGWGNDFLPVRSGNHLAIGQTVSSIGMRRIRWLESARKDPATILQQVGA